MQFGNFIYYWFFLLAPCLRTIWKMWSKKWIIKAQYIVINRFCEVLYLSFPRWPFAQFSFFFRMFICANHIYCFAYYLLSAYSKVHIFLLFSFFSVKKILFLFYPHSERSCLLVASVQSVLNHDSCTCLFLLKSSLSIGSWCRPQIGALQQGSK